MGYRRRAASAAGAPSCALPGRLAFRVRPLFPCLPRCVTAAAAAACWCCVESRITGVDASEEVARCWVHRPTTRQVRRPRESGAAVRVVGRSM